MIHIAPCFYCRLQSDITHSFHSPQQTTVGPLSWCRAGHKTKATSAPIWKWGKGGIQQLQPREGLRSTQVILVPLFQP